MGIRVALLRLQKYLSQVELGRQSGVSASAIGMYEQGRREPSLDLLASYDYLLTGEIALSEPATAQELPFITIRTETLLQLLRQAMK